MPRLYFGQMRILALLLLAWPARALNTKAPEPVLHAISPLSATVPAALPALEHVKIDRGGAVWTLAASELAQDVQRAHYVAGSRQAWLVRTWTDDGLLLQEFPSKPGRDVRAVGQASFSLLHNVLISNIETKGSALINAKAEFRAAVARFGDELEGIKGTWVFGDNLEEFNRLRKLGYTPEEAALGTWTGKRAAEAGFTKVSFTPERLEQLRTEKPGEHEKMAVLFSRPDK